MFCSTCGRRVADDARFCDNCGAVVNPQDGGRHNAAGMPDRNRLGLGQRGDIPNYLVQAILVTICCCVPAGIVAIVYAAQVNGKVASGDFAEAQRLSNNARTWCWISLGAGVAIAAVYALVIIFGGIAGSL